MTSDIDIYRSAHLLIERHGDDAPIEAAMRADELTAGGDMEGTFWMNPSVHVSSDMLFAAIEQIETLADWLEERMLAVR